MATVFERALPQAAMNWPAQVARYLGLAGRLAKRRHRSAARVKDQVRALYASGLFDCRYYRQRNPDVAEAGLDPALHYLRFGAEEGRDPHPLFNTRFYLSHNPDAAGQNPLLHYLSHGHRDPARPVSPDFDPVFFREWYTEFQPGTNPLVEYVRRFLMPAPPTEAEVQILLDECNALAPITERMDGPAPQVSVIVAVRDHLFFTLGCLRALLQHESRHRFEVLVIDDCSRDATARVIPQVRGVRYFRNSANRGFLRSCNHAAAQARGSYLVFLNNDTRVLPAWLDELIDTLKGNSAVGLAGSQLLYPGGRLQEAGGIVWSDGSASNFGRDADPDRPEYNYIREVDYCSAASVAVPRALWERLRGFDEHFAPAYYEDTDLAFRIREAGYKVLYQPFSRVIHFEGISQGRNLQHGGKRYQSTNAGRFAARHRHRLLHHRPAGSDPEWERDRGVAGRMLVIDHTTPAPDQDSGSRTALDFMRCAQDLGYKIVFLPDDLARPKRYTTALQRLGIECVAPPHITSVEDYLRRSGPMFDAVVVFRGPVGVKHLEAIKRHAPQARLIFHTVDLHYVREQRQAALDPDYRPVVDPAVTRARELSVALAADCTIVVSQFEHDLLAQELPRVAVHTFPYVMDVREPRRPFEERSDILFVGGFNHPPNVDAVRFFVKEILPAVRQGIPGVRLRVAGNNPPREVRRLACPDIIILGHVPDLDDCLERCRLSVAPIRYGAGIKGKVVYSLSRGVPCVATAMAAEGMNVRDGEQMLIANDPERFAEAVVRLYTDGRLWRSLSHAGLSFVRAEYSAEAGRQHVRTILARSGVGTEPGGRLPAG